MIYARKLSFLHSLIAVGLCLTLTACAGRPDEGALAISTLAAPDATPHEILIVTTRERDDRADTYFNGERGEGTDYAKATISVPGKHAEGSIEWPDTFPGDPTRDFVTRAASYVPDRAAMRADLNRRLMEKPKGQRSVFLFIHGYNTLFSEALFRFTQYVHDSDYDGVPVLFTWASRGQIPAYVYDLNSALAARRALAETIEDLASSKAERIFILAHSMGNWLMMETALQMTPSQVQRMENKIDHIIMAAPDIDLDVFKEQLKVLGNRARSKKPVVVMVSEDDKALGISRRIAGNKARVGAFENDEELAALGVIVINLTKLDANDRVNHSKFAQVAKLSPELNQLINQTSFRSTSDPDTPGETAHPVAQLSTLVANTAQIAITLPVALVTTPLSIAKTITQQ